MQEIIKSLTLHLRCITNFRSKTSFLVLCKVDILKMLIYRVLNSSTSVCQMKRISENFFHVMDITWRVQFFAYFSVYLLVGYIWKFCMIYSNFRNRWLNFNKEIQIWTFQFQITILKYWISTCNISIISFILYNRIMY